jgi:hypothetical protein
MLNILFFSIITILFIFSLYKEKTEKEDFIKFVLPKKNDTVNKSLKKLNIFFKDSFVNVKWRISFIFTILSIFIISLLKNKIPDNKDIVIYISVFFSCCYTAISYYTQKNMKKSLHNTNIILNKLKKISI